MNKFHSISKFLAAAMIVTLTLALFASVSNPTVAAPARQAAASPSQAALSSLPKAEQPHNPTDSNISFAPAISYTVSPNGLFGIATSDFNHDGQADLVTVSPDNSPEDNSYVYVMLNTGGGNFAAPVGYAVDKGAEAITVGDFNGDGSPDIATANLVSGTISVLLNNGSGVFGPAVSFTARPRVIAIAVGDFNRDGKLDIVASDEGGGLSLLLGNGDGTFQSPIDNDSANIEAHSLSVADLNHDGKLDLVVGGGGGAAVLLGNGDGTFQPASQPYRNNFANGAVVGDFNHDGNLDIAIDGGNYGVVAVLLGNGDGSFQPYTYFPGGGLQLATADFNHDGNLDIAANGLSISPGVGDGNFESPVNFPPNDGTYGITIGDFNGDGKPDVAIASRTGPVLVFINTSPILAQTPTPTPSSTSTPPICNGSALGPWSAGSPMSDKLASFATTSDGTYAYTAGGYYATNDFSNQLSRYDPASNTWLALAPLPFAFSGMAASYSPLNNKLYFFGGQDVNYYPNSYTYIYDPATNTWSEGRDQPDARVGAAVGYWNGKIYLAGGSGVDSHDHAQIWAYDPISNTWDTSLANMPAALDDAGYGIVNGHFYVIGGVNYPTTYNTTYDYNIAANTWTTHTNAPTTIYGPRSAVVDGRIYLFGGRPSTSLSTRARATQPDNISPLNITQVYDPAADHWSFGPLLQTPRVDGGGTAIGNRIIAFGGINNYRSELNSVEQAMVTTCGPQPTNTPTFTSTPVGPTPTDCANQFIDIGGNPFYEAIHYLNCARVVSGTDATHYTPSAISTRGQFTRVIVKGFGLQIATPAGGAQDFSDVPPSYFAYTYIETSYHAGILGGFDPTTCAAHNVIPPCYLPNLAITRAQLTKLVVGAAHYLLFTPTSGQTFNDVPPSNIFYTFIETAHQKGVINGYPDGSFRPNNSIRRDEMAQIVYKGVTTP